MFTKQINFVILMVSCIAVIETKADDDSGKYIPNKYGQSEGKYVHRDTGRYIPMDDNKYVHVHDNRELGKYIHIPFPYDGGYGPYSGVNIPYEHQGDYSNQDQTTYKPTTTEKPRRTYHDEGGWRIIRQEEKKEKKNYDFLYLTENGIYAEEQAVIKKTSSDKEGTHAKGYYEYTGDDGKLYRVDYTVGEEGFQPVGAHIPTPPPIPEAIQKSLDWLKKHNKL